MSVTVQIHSFLAFFLYGAIIVIIYDLFLKKKPIKTYLFMIASAFLFMYILYHINGGILHPYFFIILFISCIFSKMCVNLFKKLPNKLKRIYKR